VLVQEEASVIERPRVTTDDAIRSRRTEGSRVGDIPWRCCQVRDGKSSRECWVGTIWDAIVSSDGVSKDVPNSTEYRPSAREDAASSNARDI
jgi:hypothetical protein